MNIIPHPYLPQKMTNARRQNITDMNFCLVCGGTESNFLHPMYNEKDIITLKEMFIK